MSRNRFVLLEVPDDCRLPDARTWEALGIRVLADAGSLADVCNAAESEELRRCRGRRARADGATPDAVIEVKP